MFREHGSSVNAPVVSVVVPTYNAGSFLPIAVQSVFDQSYTDWELVIVDDGSTDSTPDYLRTISDSRVTTVFRAHTGNPSTVRNVALRHVAGRFVAFLDADDVWWHNKLELQVRCLEDHPACGWCYCYVRRIDPQGASLPLPANRRGSPISGWILKEVISLEAIITTPALVVRRELLERVQGFDESFRYVGDTELWSRLAQQSPAAIVPEPLVSVRSHATSHTFGVNDRFHYWIRMYDKVKSNTDDPEIHALCERQKVTMLIQQADVTKAQGRSRQALALLRKTLPAGMRRSTWWIVLVKALVRPLLPPSVRRVYHTLRRSRHVRT